MRSIVVSFFTPGFYAETAAANLLPSLSALNLDGDVREVDCVEGWISAGQYKAKFLAAACEQYPDANLLWVDVDAKIRANPFSFLESLTCDIGIHFFGEELLSGTIWLPAAGRRNEILARWNSQNESRPDRWDQQTLQAAIGDAFSVAKLPPEYCCIFDNHDQLRELSGKQPVIEHFQASRTLRKRGELAWGRPE
jgi:hypothetical protein